MKAAGGEPKTTGRTRGDPVDLWPAESAADGVRELRRRALAFGFGFVTLAVFVLLGAIYLQLLHQLLWGAALAMLFYPLHRLILGLVRGRATVAAAISTVLSIGILFLPSFLLVFNLVAEVQDLLPRIQSTFSASFYQDASTWLAQSGLQGLARFVTEEDSMTPAALQAQVEAWGTGLQTFLLERLRDVTRSIPATVIKIAMTIVIFFFFLRHGPVWAQQAQRALPLAHEHSGRLFRIAERSINAVFRGVIITAAAQGLLAGAGYWVAGAGVPVLLALATFITALIPFVGPVAIWLPVSIGLFITGHAWAAVGLAIWGTVVVSLVDNVLRPYLIGREMKLPMLWLFLAIVGGLKLFGFLGVFVGPATLALAVACWRIFMEERRPAPASSTEKAGA